MSQSLVTNSEIYSNESINCNICRREEIAHLKQIIIIFVVPFFFYFCLLLHNFEKGQKYWYNPQKIILWPLLASLTL